MNNFDTESIPNPHDNQTPTMERNIFGTENNMDLRDADPNYINRDDHSVPSFSKNGDGLGSFQHDAPPVACHNFQPMQLEAPKPATAPSNHCPEIVTVPDPDVDLPSDEETDERENLYHSRIHHCVPQQISSQTGTFGELLENIPPRNSPILDIQNISQPGDSAEKPHLHIQDLTETKNQGFAQDLRRQADEKNVLIRSLALQLCKSRERSENMSRRFEQIKETFKLHEPEIRDKIPAAWLDFGRLIILHSQLSQWSAHNGTSGAVHNPNDPFMPFAIHDDVRITDDLKIYQNDNNHATTSTGRSMQLFDFREADTDMRMECVNPALIFPIDLRCGDQALTRTGDSGLCELDTDVGPSVNSGSMDLGADGLNSSAGNPTAEPRNIAAGSQSNRTAFDNVSTQIMPASPASENAAVLLASPQTSAARTSPPSAEKVTPGDSSKPILCEHKGCSEAFKCMSSLSRHRKKVHFPHKLHTCDLCGHAFGRPYQPRNHLNKKVCTKNKVGAKQ